MDSRDVRVADGQPIFDTLDIDLVVKVLGHTAFSECASSCHSKQQLTFFQVHSFYFSFQFSTSFRVPNSLTLQSFGLACIMW
jgi:hypothetical protein